MGREQTDYGACTRCGVARETPAYRWCGACRERHRRRMRERRARGLDTYASLSPEQRRRATARAYLNTYVRRGRLVRPTRCEVCGTDERRIEAHHPDYARPLEVRWLCTGVDGCHAFFDGLAPAAVGG